MKTYSYIHSDRRVVPRTYTLSDHGECEYFVPEATADRAIVRRGGLEQATVIDFALFRALRQSPNVRANGTSRLSL